MSGSISTFTRNRVMDLVFGKVPWTPPADYWFGIWLDTAVINEDSSGATGGEVTSVGTGYTRVHMTNDLTTFAVSVNGLKTLAVDLVFPTALLSLGSAKSILVLDAASAGNMIAWYERSVPQTIPPGPVRVRAGDLAWTWGLA